MEEGGGKPVERVRLLACRRAYRAAEEGALMAGYKPIPARGRTINPPPASRPHVGSSPVGSTPTRGAALREAASQQETVASRADRDGRRFWVGAVRLAENLCGRPVVVVGSVVSVSLLVSMVRRVVENRGLLP